MSSCTFFGSKNSPESVKEPLRQTLVYLIEACGVDDFYVGCQGAFDSMVLRAMRELAQLYPIRNTVVLAYHPGKQYDLEPNPIRPEESILPEEVAAAYPRFAIHKRNRWMLSREDTVVSCVVNPRGGANKFTELAIKAGKRVINLQA